MSIDKLDLQSPDLVNENFEKLAVLFPNCVTESAEGKAIDFKVAQDSLFACFDKGIDEAFAKEIAKESLRVVFRDNGFSNDTAKTNVQQLMKQLSPETEMKVI